MSSLWVSLNSIKPVKNELCFIFSPPPFINLNPPVFLWGRDEDRQTRPAYGTLDPIAINIWKHEIIFCTSPTTPNLTPSLPHESFTKHEFRNYSFRSYKIKQKWKWIWNINHLLIYAKKNPSANWKNRKKIKLDMGVEENSLSKRLGKNITSHNKDRLRQRWCENNN